MRWTIGNVTITRIVEMEMGPEMGPLIPDATPEAVRSIEWLMPEFATPEGVLLYSFHALVIETPSIRILVDTCVGNDKPRPQTPFWDLMQSRFLDDLIAAGYPPETIDFVICTHLHLDHVGWNTRLVDGQWIPTFPNARYLLGEEELAFFRAEVQQPHLSEMGELQRHVMLDSVEPVLAAGLVDLVPSDHRLCSEVHLRPSPGHTPGHVCVVIQSEGEQALITGDAIHHPCQLSHPEWSTIADHDGALTISTRRDLLANLSNSDTLVIGTHWPGRTAGHIVRYGNAYKIRDD